MSIVKRVTKAEYARSKRGGPDELSLGTAGAWCQRPAPLRPPGTGCSRPELVTPEGSLVRLARPACYQ